MSDAPERMWVLRPDDRDIMIIEEPCDGWDGYVRADLFDAQARRIEELEGALEPLANYDGFFDPEFLSREFNNLLATARAALSKGTEGE